MYQFKAVPTGQEGHIPNGSGQRIHRPSAANADALKRLAGLCGGVAQHGDDSCEGITRAALGIGGALSLSQYLTRLIDHANGYFGSANIDCADHEMLS
jgi:hypothetical protein